MQADAEHVHAEPGECRDDISEDRQVHQSPFPNHSAPTRMEDECVPDDDNEGAIFFRVPTPKTAPGLIGPDATKDRAYKAKQGGEADNRIAHFRERFSDILLRCRFAAGAASCRRCTPG